MLGDVRFVWPIAVVFLAVVWQGVRLKRWIVWLWLSLLGTAVILGLMFERGSNAVPHVLPFLVVWTGIVAACALGTFLWTARYTEGRVTLGVAAAAGGVIGTILAIVPALLVGCAVTGECL